MHTRQSVAAVPLSDFIDGSFLVTAEQVKDGVYSPERWHKETIFVEDLGEVRIANVPEKRENSPGFGLELSIGAGTIICVDQKIYLRKLSGSGNLSAQRTVEVVQARHTGKIRAMVLMVTGGGSVGDVFCKDDLIIDLDGPFTIHNDLEVRSNLQIGSHSWFVVEGDCRLFTVSGSSLRCHGSIEAEEINLDGHIEADGDINVVRDLRAGMTIRAGGQLSAGWRIMAGIAEDQLPFFSNGAIFCSQLAKGTIAAGHLHLNRERHNENPVTP